MRLAGALLLAALCTGRAAAAAEMIEQPTAQLQGLDKTTARISKFDAPVGTEVHFGTLSILVRTCQRTPPEVTPENAAFLEIFEIRPGEQKEKLFSGWMFSSSPALSALEHPVYDVNLLECKGTARSPPLAPAPAAPKSSGRSRGKTAR